MLYPGWRKVLLPMHLSGRRHGLAGRLAKNLDSTQNAPWDKDSECSRLWVLKKSVIGMCFRLR